jgi:hypothetical protein
MHGEPRRILAVVGGEALRRTNEILKAAASSFFATELDRPQQRS